MARMKAAIFALFSAIAFTQFAGCAADPNTRSTGQFVDDAAITAKVKTALVQAPEVSAWDINVNTYRGVVQLSGFVPTEEARREAIEAARMVEGVRSVDANLEVQPKAQR